MLMCSGNPLYSIRSNEDWDFGVTSLLSLIQSLHWRLLTYICVIHIVDSSIKSIHILWSCILMYIESV